MRVNSYHYNEYKASKSNSYALILGGLHMSHAIINTVIRNM